MLLKDLFAYVVKNEGATIDTKKQPLTKKSGYMVSLANYELKINVDFKEFKKYFKKYKRLLKRLKKTYKNVYIGLWIDSNILYYDISIYIDDLSIAIYEAFKNNQLAIYDLKENKSIYMKL